MSLEIDHPISLSTS